MPDIVVDIAGQPTQTFTVTDGSTIAPTGYTPGVTANIALKGEGAAATTSTYTDVTAPILTSPTDAADGATASTASVSTNEASGTLYHVLTTSATAPSQAQLAAGQDHTGAAAAHAGNQTVSATGVQTITPAPSGLTAETAYFTHFMHEDAATNRSTVVSASGFTTAAASAFTAPTHSGNAIFGSGTANPEVTDAGATLSVSTGAGGDVLINLMSFGTVAPASVVIGGVTATLDSSDTTVGDRNFFTYLASGVPSGTQDLTITHATGQTSNMLAAVYGGGASFVVDNAVFVNGFGGDPTADINVAAGNAVYAMSNFGQTTAGTRNADGPQLNVSGTAFDLFHDFFGIGLDINAFSATGLSAATPQTFTISDPDGSTTDQTYGWFVTVTEAP